MLQRHRLNNFISKEQGATTDSPSNSFASPAGMTSNHLPGLPTASPDPFYSTTHLDFDHEGKTIEGPLSATNEAIPTTWGDEKLVPKAKAVRRKWKKPKDKPKRPLSAYNIFFQHERLNMITPIPNDKPDPGSGNEKLGASTDTVIKSKKSGDGGFAGLTRQIASKWNALDSETRSVYEIEAKKEQLRYAKELEEWKKKKAKQRIEEEELKLKASLFESDEGRYTYDAIEQQFVESDSLHTTPIQASALHESFESPNQSISDDYEAPRFLPLHYSAHDSIDDWTSLRFGTHQMNPLPQSFFPPDMYGGVTYYSNSIFEPAAWHVPKKNFTFSESLTLLFEQLDEDEQELLLHFGRGR